MDFTVATNPVLGPAKNYIVAYGQLKLIRDTSVNDKIKSDSYERRRPADKSLRKLQLVKKNVTKTGQSDTSDDTSTSRQAEISRKLKNPVCDDKKPSLIPRRKSNIRDVPAKGPSSSTMKNIPSRNYKPLIEHKNVQRVQHLNINQEFCPENYSAPKSETSARPIPTLGHIYREDSTWLLDTESEYRDGPENILNSNDTINTPFTQRNSSVTSNNISKTKTSGLNANQSSSRGLSTKKSSGLKTFKTTDENVRDWLSSELEQPTRDNESGYQSINPPSQITFTGKTTEPKTFENKVSINREKRNKIHNSKEITSSTTKKPNQNNSDMFGEEGQSTVIINKRKIDSTNTSDFFGVPKMNTDLKLTKNLRTDIHKPFKYYSTPNPAKKKENNEKIPVSSYVEYPSEVLQKTTNFETHGCDTFSLATGVDSETRDDLSSTIEHIDENFPADNDTDWSIIQSSQDNTTTWKSSKTSNNTEFWRSNTHDTKETHHFKCPDKCSYHDYYYHYCWRKEVAKKDFSEQSLWDCKGRCKKCQKYRRRHKEKNNHIYHRILRNFTISAVPGPFQSLKKHISIGRICRHRWDRVWKKTTEKWSNWSNSTSKKFRVMNIQKLINWDNATVQTTLFVYNEIGTDCIAREQRSAEITAAFKTAWSRCIDGQSTMSTRSNKCGMKHANIGPSMFTFPQNTSMMTSRHSKQVTQSKAISCAHCPIVDETKSKEVRNISYQAFKERDNFLKGVTGKRNKSISKSSLAIPVYVQENYTEVTPLVVENKVTSTLIHNIDKPMTITCKNAATDVKFTPINSTMDSKFNQVSFSSYYVDAETETEPPDDHSLNSVKVMTSTEINKELNHKEIQVLPAHLLRKMSTEMSVPRQLISDAKSSVVTDTVIPCRRLENTLVTNKGTILTCTGTKVTSVSSDNIQPSSIQTSTLSRISKIVTANIGTSTNFSTKDTDCSTAPSLYKRYLRDAYLATLDLENNPTCDVSTCPQLQSYSSAGISAIDLIERNSVSGGSHITQCSCNTGFCPDCHSICVNAVTELNSKSTETSQYFDNQESNNKQIKTDCFVQYSNFSKDSTKHLARIGRSRLLSVRTFMSSEAGTQKSACFTSKCTNDVKQMSQNFMKPNALLANEPNFVISSNLNAAKWIKGYVKEDEKDIQSIIDISETTVNESLERASFAITHSKHETRGEIKKKSTVIANRQPAVNCVTEKLLGAVPSTSVTEIQLIKDHKEILCTSSALTHEDVRSNFETITCNRKKSKVSKENITSDEPTKDISQLYEKSVISNKPKILMADKITSDDTMTKYLKESIVQVQPNLQDIGVNYTEEREYKSNFALTSRHILPSIACGELCSFKNTADCLFVYNRPRCIIHNYRTDAAIQLQLSSKNIGSHLLNGASNCNKSFGQITSFPVHNNNRKNETLGVLSPKTNNSLSNKNESGIKQESKSSKSNSVGTSSKSDTIDEFMKSHLEAYCRYYSNLLTVKLEKIKENFKKQLAPSTEDSLFSTSVPNIFTEACTMKPSGKRDQNCQTKSPEKPKTHINEQLFLPRNLNINKNPSCLLSPVFSLVDIRRNQDTEDLKTVYYILTAIEGRVRRLKNNLRM